MSDTSNNPNDTSTAGDGSPGLGGDAGGGAGGGSRGRDPLGDIAAKIDAALSDLRPKLKSAIQELDQKVDAAIGDVKTRARPKVDELVTDLQPKLDSLINRIQGALEGLKRDLEGRADRAESRQGSAEGAAAGHWPEMKEDTKPADPPMEKPFGPRAGASGTTASEPAPPPEGPIDTSGTGTPGADDDTTPTA